MKEKSPGSANKDYRSRQNAGNVELTYNPNSLGVETKDLKHPTELGIAAFEGMAPSSHPHPTRVALSCVRPLDAARLVRAHRRAPRGGGVWYAMIRRNPLLDPHYICLRSAAPPHLFCAGPGKYRYMFQKLRDMSDVVDERIDVLGERITKRHNLLKAEDKDGNPVVSTLAHVAMPNQEEVTIVGRVCLDAAGEGKLNAKSVKLEGSRITSNGARVDLNLDNTQSFSIFPGQIVAATGTNSTGTNFTPTVMYQGAAYPMMRTQPEAFLEHYFTGADEGTQVVDIMVAAGPFTTTDDISYSPLEVRTAGLARFFVCFVPYRRPMHCALRLPRWPAVPIADGSNGVRMLLRQDLLDVIKRETPDAVILLGPFVDESHPIIKNAEMDVP